MKNILTVVENTEDLVVLEVKELSNREVASKPWVNNNMEFITVTKGAKHILTITHKDGRTTSFHWGSGGYTLISDNLERLQREVVQLLEDNDVFIGIKSTELPEHAKSYKMPRSEAWQLRLEGPEGSHNLWFDTEEELTGRASKLGYTATHQEHNQFVGTLTHYSL